MQQFFDPFPLFLLDNHPIVQYDLQAPVFQMTQPCWWVGKIHIGKGDFLYKRTIDEELSARQ